MRSESSPLSASEEILSFEDVTRRLARFDTRYAPLCRYLTNVMEVAADVLLSRRGMFALIASDPDEAVRRHKQRWASLDLPEEVIDSLNPTTEKAQEKLREELHFWEQEERDILKAITAMEHGNVRPMYEYLQKVRERSREDEEFAQAKSLPSRVDGGVSDTWRNQAIDLLGKELKMA